MSQSTHFLVYVPVFDAATIEHREECCEKGAEWWSAVDMEAMEKRVHVASAGNVAAAVIAANINPGWKDLEEDRGGKGSSTEERGGRKE